MSSGLRYRRTDRSPVLPIDKRCDADIALDKKHQTFRGGRNQCLRILNTVLPRILALCFILISAKKTWCAYGTDDSVVRPHPRHKHFKPHAIQIDGRDVHQLDLSQVKLNPWPGQRRSVGVSAIVMDYNLGIQTDHDDDESGDDDDWGDCIPMVDWQEFVFPTCNKVHENDILGGGEYIDSGYNRDVWSLRDFGETYIVLKTLSTKHPFTTYMINLQRIDALISERTTASKYITNIYAYCGASAVNDFASEGSLDDAYESIPLNDRLQIATDVAHGLFDFHSLKDEKGRTAVIHTDIAVRQFVQIKGRFQLNDFNTAKLVYQHSETGDLCKQYMHKAKDKNRSPEEMLGESNEVTEMIDVYSMGNIFYKLLTNERKYSYLNVEQAQYEIKKNALPPISPMLEASVFPVHVALRNAIIMSLQRYPEKRKNAKEIYDYLAAELSRFKEKTVV